MGCVASKLEEEEEVVGLCRERKRLLKSAVDCRYTLADAHCKYIHSLFAVAATLDLFIARHSSPSSSFLITFPPPCPPSPPFEEKTISNNPLFLQQTPTKSTQEAVVCQDSDSTISSESSERGERHHTHRETEQVCGYFYSAMPPPMPSPQRDFGWDFFNPFDGVRPEVIGGFNRNSDEDLRVVREQEGIPELEDEEEKARQWLPL
ncbi:hypothetical protein ACHQM5_025992 [Ranunculus cassubicifolius]